MIKFELAKQLKDAGFPQEYRKTPIAMDWVYDSTGELMMIHDDNDTSWWLGQDYVVRFNEELLQKEYIKCPTMDELIEACGKFKIDFLLRDFATGDNNEWICGNYMPHEHEWIQYSTGSTPEEAVARLWLDLNKK